MAHRLDGEIHNVYKACLEEVSKVKARPSRKQTVEYSSTASSRDEAVRIRHKHLAVAKLLQNDGYNVVYFPEGDEMPKGKYLKALGVGMTISWSTVSDGEE